MTALPGYDDFVVMVFDYQNTGAQPINGLYSGMIGDFDVGTSTDDVAYTEATRRTAYIYEQGVGNPTMGFKLLDPTSASNLTVIDHDIYVYPETAMSEGAKFGFLDGTLSFPQSNRTYDWSVCVAAGPFDLPPGETHRVAYAVVGGSDETSYLVNCDSAQSWYDRNLVGINEQPRSLRTPHSALAIAPNPFSRLTHISYTMPQAGNLSIRVYDATGRHVATLLEDKVPAGTGVINWQPKNVARGIYFVRARMNDNTVVEKVMLVR
jgi:hypothetical protein